MKWISVKDELPEIGDRYITYSIVKNDMAFMDHIEAAHYYQSGWQFDSCEEIEPENTDWDITHWMPLPKPPEK